jgi:hypothetical protein
MAEEEMGAGIHFHGTFPQGATGGLGKNERKSASEGSSCRIPSRRNQELPKALPPTRPETVLDRCEIPSILVRNLGTEPSM